ncbi:MAG: PHP domain-containing protein [Clostridia bacterium]|nr:PHP domain-containing protein [Clostridia bacterium]
MRYIVDHDLHIHSQLSLCSNDPAQTPEAILAYGEKNGFKTLCLTDHMWDPAVPGASGWYARQPFERTCEALPLPQSDTVKFLFGCETDQDRYMTVGVSPAVMEKLDFIIIPTTHLHMHGFTLDGSEGVEERAKLWCDRFEAVLDMDLPFYKIGIAHLTCSLMYREHHIEVLNTIPEAEYHRLFARAAKVGVGIELNFPSLSLNETTKEPTLRPYRIAKEEGCKFYFGSDAHHPAELASAMDNFQNIVDLLGLEESDKIAFLK